MSNTCIINLQNKMATRKTLWLFLQEPEVVVSSEVFSTIRNSRRALPLIFLNAADCFLSPFFLPGHRNYGSATLAFRSMHQSAAVGDASKT